MQQKYSTKNRHHFRKFYKFSHSTLLVILIEFSSYYVLSNYVVYVAASNASLKYNNGYTNFPTLIKYRNFNYCFNYWPECFCSLINRIECHSNFSSLKQLKLNELISNRISYLSIESTDHRQKPKFLNNELNVSGLLLDSSRFHFVLSNIDGIELTENPFSNYTHANKRQLSHLLISNSTMEFFYRGKNFEWICDLIVYDNTLMPIFASFRSIYLGNMGSPVKYPKSPICPTVFKNAMIEWLCLFNLTSANKLNFIQLAAISHQQNETKSKAPTKEYSLNSIVRNLRIQSSHIYLDQTLLDHNVFGHMEKLTVEFSFLAGIQADLFKNFLHLKRLRLWLFDFRKFVHSSTKWIAYLNYELNVNINNISDIIANRNNQMFVELNDEDRLYDYPDEDFCLFEEFPHNRLVFVYINTKPNLNCTCTLLWLLKNFKYSTANLETTSTMRCLREDDFDALLFKCNFDQRIFQCKKSEANNKIYAITHLKAASTTNAFSYVLNGDGVVYKCLFFLFSILFIF
jgi:hypothetical protein